MLLGILSSVIVCGSGADDRVTAFDPGPSRRWTVRQDDEVTAAEAGTVHDQRIADTTPLALAMRMRTCSTGRRVHDPVLTAVPSTTVAARR